MPVYIYETIEKRPRRFEIRQSMKDAALTHDPESGKPVRRVISGGYGVMQKGGSGPAPQGGGCGSACGCHP